MTSTYVNVVGRFSNCSFDAAFAMAYGLLTSPNVLRAENYLIAFVHIRWIAISVTTGDAQHMKYKQILRRFNFLRSNCFRRYFFTNVSGEEIFVWNSSNETSHLKFVDRDIVSVIQMTLSVSKRNLKTRCQRVCRQHCDRSLHTIGWQDEFRTYQPF